jgi:hypothetical protein
VSAPPRRRDPRLRAALLSGLVLPGLGQLANGHPWRALAFSSGTVAALAVLLRRVVHETLARMPRDPLDFDAGLPFRLVVEIHRANARFFFWITVVVLALWIGSVVDAWYGAKRG